MGSHGADDALVVISRPDDENNGQALRVVVALSAIISRPVKIENIRALSKTPGTLPLDLLYHVSILQLVQRSAPCYGRRAQWKCHILSDVTYQMSLLICLQE